MSEWTQNPRYDEPPTSLRWAIRWVWLLLHCRLLGHRFSFYRTDDPDWPTFEGQIHEETRYCLRCDDTWTRPVGVAIHLAAAADTSTSTPSANG